jgi:hypothetical protein
MFRFVIPAAASSGGSTLAFLAEGETPVEIGLEGILTGTALEAPENVATSPHDPIGGPENRGRVSSFRTLVNIAAMVMVLVVVGTGTFLFLGRSPSAEAAVALALNSTLANRTADLAVNGSVGVGTSRVAITGSGTVNFDQSAAQLDLNTSIHGHVVTEQEIAIGDTIYLNLGPLVSQIEPSKSWISLNLSQLNQGGTASPLGIGGGLSTNNPAAILNVLGQNGNIVTALGQSTINGTTVQGYSVQVNQSVIHADLARAHLPMWMQQSVAVSGNLDVSYKVYIDNSGMLDRMTIDLAVPVDGKSLTGDIALDFSNFGTPTSIAAPPSTQVATYQSFLQKF